jgi:hypothetical protein
VDLLDRLIGMKVYGRTALQGLPLNEGTTIASIQLASIEKIFTSSTFRTP